MLVGIPYNPGHTRQRCQFFGRPLGVATGHQNAAIGIQTLQAAYGCAGIFVRSLGHGAGIQDHDFGVENRPSSLQSALQKLPFQRRPIRLRSSAAEILYVEARHVLILTEWNSGVAGFAEEATDDTIKTRRSGWASQRPPFAQGVYPFGDRPQRPFFRASNFRASKKQSGACDVPSLLIALAA